MKRTVSSLFEKWKDSHGRKPLVVRGARQIGKSHSIKEFGQQHFQNQCVVVDFEKQLGVCKVFEQDLAPQRIVTELETILRAKIVPGQTLLFFDEIQMCPRAITALRYFYEDMPQLHVISAGSLLEFALGTYSVPVGRIHYFEMFPLSFSEFLEATGHSKMAEIVSGPPQPLSPVIHDAILQQLKVFFFVGGMPEAVARYVQTNSILDAADSYRDLVHTYRQDFSKYIPRVDTQCLDEVLRNCAIGSCRQAKYVRLAQGHASITVKKALHALNMAKVVYSIKSTKAHGHPLGAMSSDKIFKPLMVDLAFVHSFSGLNPSTEYQAGNLLDIYRGQIAEQFVGQELLTTQKDGLYYWMRAAKNSNAEVDFIANIAGDIIPIEVKNDSAGHLKSLSICLDENKNCPHGIVFSTRPYSYDKKHKIKFIPLYWAQSASSIPVQ